MRASRTPQLLLSGRSGLLRFDLPGAAWLVDRLVRPSWFVEFTQGRSPRNLDAPKPLPVTSIPRSSTPIRAQGLNPGELAPKRRSSEGRGARSCGRKLLFPPVVTDEARGNAPAQRWLEGSTGPERTLSLILTHLRGRVRGQRGRVGTVPTGRKEIGVRYGRCQGRFGPYAGEAQVRDGRRCKVKTQ
jgi:hypothetical protein